MSIVGDPFRKLKKVQVLSIEKILEFEKNNTFKLFSEVIVNINNGKIYQKNFYLDSVNKNVDLPQDINDLILRNSESFASIIKVFPTNLPSNLRTYRLYQNPN